MRTASTRPKSAAPTAMTPVRPIASTSTSPRPDAVLLDNLDDNGWALASIDCTAAQKELGMRSRVASSRRRSRRAVRHGVGAAARSRERSNNTSGTSRKSTRPTRPGAPRRSNPRRTSCRCARSRARSARRRRRWPRRSKRARDGARKDARQTVHLREPAGGRGYADSRTSRHGRR